jgi:radical SAM superfamily enzyme
MTLIDGDRIITTQLYDDEHEEYIDKKMSIIDFVNRFSDEGVTTTDDILDKIKTEIKKAIWEDVIVGLDGTDETRIPCLNPDDVLEIIDKYKAESEDRK